MAEGRDSSHTLRLRREAALLAHLDERSPSVTSQSVGSSTGCGTEQEIRQTLDKRRTRQHHRAPGAQGVRQDLRPHMGTIANEAR